MRSVLFAACLAASLSVSAVGMAQPSKPSPTHPQSDAKTDQARELHIKGAAFYEQGQYDKAEAAFLAAWALKKHYQIASNLGACEMKLGKYADAAEHLGFFLREQPSTANKEDRVHTQALFDEARAKVGAVLIQVNVPGAVVSIGGREIGAAPLSAEVYLEPGSQTIEASHGGYNDARQVVEAKAGGTGTVTLVLTEPTGKASASGTPVAPPVPIPPPPRSVVPGVVLGGVGAAALATGIGFMVDAGVKRSSSHDLNSAILSDHHSCVAGSSNYDARCGELNDTSLSARANRRVGAGLLVGAGVAAAGAAAYFLWPTKKFDTQSSHALRVVPVVSTRDAGFILSGAF